MQLKTTARVKSVRTEPTQLSSNQMALQTRLSHLFDSSPRELEVVVVVVMLVVTAVQLMHALHGAAVRSLQPSRLAMAVL
mmetsp:Transcript_65986/g.129431  ORF Transcript_65986/g.129431 Transcript_65986/m.129431 type:complete len:80 (+) Transcript_65986:99-338(+)